MTFVCLRVPEIFSIREGVVDFFPQAVVAYSYVVLLYTFNDQYVASCIFCISICRINDFWFVRMIA